MKWIQGMVAVLAVTTAGCAAAVGAGVGAAAYAAFDAWDLDANVTLDRAEFNEGLREAGIFDDWDDNDDRFLSESEWADEVDDWDLEAGSFAEWDLDGDGRLTEEEFSTGLFGIWDTDGNGMITESEFDEGVDLF